MPNGIAYGFIGLRHLFGLRLANLPPGTPSLRDAVIASARNYTDTTNQLLQEWVQVTTSTRQRVLLPGSATLQPLDEWGNPKPIKAGSSYVAGFPMAHGGTAWGDNRITRALMTVEEANNETLAAFTADADWNRRHILAAVFDNVAWTYNDPTERDVDADIPIVPLANGDSVVYQRNGSLGLNTDNHYLAQAAAISDAANPYPVLYRELSEHPGNGGPYVAYIASSLIAATQALAEFVEEGDPDVTKGANSDTLARQGGARVLGLGDEVLGKIDRMWVVEWKSLPDGYIFARALGSGPFVSARDYPVPALQGFYPEFHSPDGNVNEYRFLRHRGYGVRNRIAAAVMQIGNASYQVPAGYTAATLY